MTPLEAKLAELLVDCESLLEPVRVFSRKWVILSSTHKQVRKFFDNKASLFHSYIRAHDRIAALKSFAIAKDAFERDNVFFNGEKKAGYSATFEAVLKYLIESAGQIRKRSVLIDHAEALRSLQSFRKALTSRHLKYDALARLFGVNLRCKSLSLPDGVTLYRLTQRERNERQPAIDLFRLYGWEEHAIGDHPAEIRVSITVPVEHPEEGAFYKAKQNAASTASEIFSKTSQAILVATGGNVKVGAIDLKGGLEQLPIGKTIVKDIPFPKNVILGKSDVANIRVAYDLVSGGKRGDKILSRALHRFILGRQRADLIDKLVDYVIAWEAVLLTQDGTPITQELSYRFALNGASIICRTERGSDPSMYHRKMRSAYLTRSSIVHGGEDKDRDKALKIGDFKNLRELCDFLENNFRRVVFWLASMKADIRPYRQHGGWELLIWPKK
jgi:hypothetical protein